MLSKPTTDHVINGVRATLDEQVLPKLTDEPTRVAVQMMQQILRGAAVRAAHEIAWMHEEIAGIRVVAAGAADDAAVAEAVAALDGLDALDAASLHLEDVQARYDKAGEVLSRCVEAAYAAGDDEAVERARAVLALRSAHEMEIIGQLDLVGRG
ncbi:MAG: hypothetical protein ACR2HP_03360 [Ilumatobacteraceae bacterium]